MRHKKCEICDQNSWSIVYSGDVRAGAENGRTKYIEGNVYCCSVCGVQRLNEALTDEDYKSGAYLANYPTADKTHQLRDELHLAPYHEMVGKVVMDVGAGNGDFLERLRGKASHLLAIEPHLQSREQLTTVGIEAFSTLYNACKFDMGYWQGKVDFITCFSVIEHVEDPMNFLYHVTRLLTDGGVLLISTPNSKDINLELIDGYPKFFYRTAHKWYFDELSLEYALGMAGLHTTQTFFMQRFGLNNLLGWLKHDKPPKGERLVKSRFFDKCEWDWAVFAENARRSDYLFNVSRKIADKEIN